MISLIDPNLAYLSIFAAVMLALVSLLQPRATWPKLWLAACLLLAALELSQLRANPWALIVTALSPLPYYILLRQKNFSIVLLFLAVGMLTFGAPYVVSDQNGAPAVNMGLATTLGLFCGMYLWMSAKRAVQGPRPVITDPMVGMLGEALTEIDDFGMVKVEGESVPARSTEHIPAGSQVRVLRAEGRVLLVKKVESLPKK